MNKIMKVSFINDFKACRSEKVDDLSQVRTSKTDNSKTSIQNVIFSLIAIYAMTPLFRSCGNKKSKII